MGMKIAHIAKQPDEVLREYAYWSNWVAENGRHETFEAWAKGELDCKTRISKKIKTLTNK